MKKVFLILICFTGSFAIGNDLNFDSIKKDSEIKINFLPHWIILENIDGEEKVLARIEYKVVCKNGNVNIRKTYFTNKNETIIKKEQTGLSLYLQFWKDIINIGLEDLASLPLDEAIDPFEFIDSWDTGKNTYHFYFKVKQRTINFNLYNIDSYRDKRFISILNRVMIFFNKKKPSR
jgi:hypothetical protein